MNDAISPMTEVTIIEWTPDDGTEPPVALGALLSSYHLATEAEKTARGLGDAAPTVDDLPERYRSEVAAPCAAFAGRTVLLAVSDGVSIGCAILSGTGAPGGSGGSGGPGGSGTEPSGTASDGDSSSAASSDGTSTSASVDRPPVDLGIDLSRLWVDPTARRTGAGGALVRHAVALGEERGAESIRLSVWRWRSDAIALYRRNGFAHVPSWDARPELVCFELRLPDTTPGHRG